jgi:hypothetical protein
MQLSSQERLIQRGTLFQADDFDQKSSSDCFKGYKLFVQSLSSQERLIRRGTLFQAKSEIELRLFQRLPALSSVARAEKLVKYSSVTPDERGRNC